MPLQAKRFEDFSEDTNLPIFDFNEAGNDGPLNAVTQEVKTGLQGLEKSLKGAKKTLDGLAKNKFPNPMGDLSDPDKLTEQFLKDIKSDIPIVSALSKSGIGKLYDSIVTEYTSLTNALGIRGGGNLVSPQSSFTDCDFDLNGLLDFLDISGFGIDLNAMLAGFLGLINRLLCAGVSTAFNVVKSFIPDPGVMVKAAAGTIMSAARLGDINAIHNVAMDSVGGSIKAYVPGIASMTTSALVSFSKDPRDDYRASYTMFKESMSALDKNWKGNSAINTYFARHAPKETSKFIGKVVVGTYPTINASANVPSTSEDVKLMVGSKYTGLYPMKSIHDEIAQA